MARATISLLRVLSFLVTLAGLCVAAPAEDSGRITIGYRTVHPDQGKRYNQRPYLVYEDWGGRARVGTGVYITPKRGGWKEQNYWTCHITADKAEWMAWWMKVPKIWIPPADGCNNKLWHAHNDVVDDYIRKFSAEYVEQHRDKLPPGAQAFDPSKTVRLARLHKRGPDNMLVLPPGILPEDGGTLKAKAWCDEDINKIPDIPVDVDSWDILGKRTSK